MKHRLPLAWLVAVLGSAAWAQPGDPLRSPACLRAIDALQTEEARGASAATSAIGGTGPRAPSTELLKLRKSVAGVCLQAWMDAPPPATRMPQEPIHIAPVLGLLGLPPRAAVIAPAAASPARQQVPAPTTLISCDAGGCLASDGTRLPRVGGVLVGPAGVCSGRVVGQSCP